MVQIKGGCFEVPYKPGIEIEINEVESSEESGKLNAQRLSMCMVNNYILNGFKSWLLKTMLRWQ